MPPGRQELEHRQCIGPMYQVLPAACVSLEFLEFPECLVVG